MNISKDWWKILSVLLLIYTITAGFLMPVPALPILNESIRNQYFHVPMWFSMIFILLISVIYSIRYLGSDDMKYDVKASETAKVGVLFGILGLLTGSIWARVTWGAWWVNDPKINGAAITLLIYLAYLVLRNSFDDDGKKARISSVYSIFAYAMLIVFLVVLPRMTDSLHPGSGGNPGFSNYDLDNYMKLVFYPAIVGWIMLGVWIARIRERIKLLEYEITIGGL